MPMLMAIENVTRVKAFVNIEEKEWVKVDSCDNLTINYLDIENELTELVKKGFVRARDVSKVLCQDLSKHCSRARLDPHFNFQHFRSISLLPAAFLHRFESPESPISICL